MKKITILALHLGVGGVERSIASLSNMLAKRYEVEIISVYQIEEKPGFHINEKVKIRYLLPHCKPNKKDFKDAVKRGKIVTILKEGIKAVKILYLKNLLMKKAIQGLSCDIAISTRDIHNELLGKYAKEGIIKIAQEHNNNGNEKYVNNVIKTLKNIDYFIPVSHDLEKIYKKRLQGKRVKCYYIPHCLERIPKDTSKLDKKNIISIGRLSWEKGFLDLIDIFEIVVRKNPDWKLNIVGDGMQREEIEKKIKDKHLENSIVLCGLKKDEELDNLLLQSSIYVMTSYNESFGLVLIEAESYGIPIIAFDSAKGPKEIIENEENGFLISDRDKNQMAEVINKLISDEGLRSKLGKVGREKSEKYKMENVEKIWYKFIDEI